MKEQILNALKDFKFTQVGVVNLTQPTTIPFYENWLTEGLNADMKYLMDHLPLKKDLSEFLPNAKSVIIVTLDYFEHPKPINQNLGAEEYLTKKSKNKMITNMKIASYAKGEDYHYFFKNQLELAKYRLETLFPVEKFKTATDSQPILERDFAYQAGLGWFGKNTMLIHQKFGSYFLIGEIVTTLALNPNSNLDSNLDSTLHPDRCGTCTKCIDACPTEALTPKKLDANKCISYWTIESKSVPDISFAQRFDSWFFGCDVCQDVCPWNIKLHTLNKISQKNQTERELVLFDILSILKSSNKALEKKFKSTPLSRARGFGLKRNALIVAMNMNAIEIKDELENLNLKNETLNEFKRKVIEQIRINY